MPICVLHDLTKWYGRGPARICALRSVSLTIEAGEFSVLCGPSGSGKTTLLNQIGCLDAADGGELVLAGKSTRGLSSRALSQLRARKIGFVFQTFNLVAVLTALENVELALELARVPGDHRASALDALARVGLAGLEHRRPHQLSGGQQQRVAIARALVKRPLLVIADEPTASLDTENARQVVATMQRLNRELGTTFVLSSHDARIIAHARRILTMQDGSLVRDERVTPSKAPLSITCEVHS